MANRFLKVTSVIGTGGTLFQEAKSFFTKEVVPTPMPAITKLGLGKTMVHAITHLVIATTAMRAITPMEMDRQARHAITHLVIATTRMRAITPMDLDRQGHAITRSALATT